MILMFEPTFSSIGHDFLSLGTFYYFCLDHLFSTRSSFKTQLIPGQMQLLGMDRTSLPSLPSSLAWLKAGTSQTSRECLLHGQMIA